MDAVGQVFCRLALSYISVVQMIDHFRYASGVEAYTRHTAGHGFHDHIRQVLFERRYRKKVYGIVYIDQFVFILNIRKRINTERNQVLQLLRLIAENDYAQ